MQRVALIAKLTSHCAGRHVAFQRWCALKLRKESILVLALVSFAGMAAAQAPPPTARFAVEIPLPGPNAGGLRHHYSVVPDSCAKPTVQQEVWECSLFFFDPGLRHLPGFPASANQPSALRLETKPGSDGVSFTVTVFYGAFDRQKLPDSLEKLPRKTIGTYFAKLNESVTLSDLAQVGLEPITLRVVSARAENPWSPILRSNAPSLQIGYTQLYRSFGTVTIHNFSDKGVAALSLEATDENGKNPLGEAPGSMPWSKALIAPGGTYRTRYGVPAPGRKLVNGVYVTLPPYAFLTLQSVLFEDGSYEGDKQMAEGMAARRLGYKVQMQRVLSLAEPIIADEQTDDAAKIRAVRAAVNQLSEEPDAQIMRSLRAEFGKLTRAPVPGPSVRQQISMAMRNVKRTIDNSIQRYQDETRVLHMHMSFARWWADSVIKPYH